MCGQPGSVSHWPPFCTKLATNSSAFSSKDVVDLIQDGIDVSIDLRLAGRRGIELLADDVFGLPGGVRALLVFLSICRETPPYFRHWSLMRDCGIPRRARRIGLPEIVSVQRIMGIETEYGVSSPGHPHANAMLMSSQVVTAYDRAANARRNQRTRWDYDVETRFATPVVSI